MNLKQAAQELMSAVKKSDECIAINSEPLEQLKEKAQALLTALEAAEVGDGYRVSSGEHDEIAFVIDTYPPKLPAMIKNGTLYFSPSEQDT